MNIFIEGCHLKRGMIAAMCAKHALPRATIEGLSWKNTCSLPFHTNLHQAASLEEYYEHFERFLKAEADFLIIPCTQKGNIIANRFSGRHNVLAEECLNNADAFNKTRLRSQQSALSSYMLPSLAITDKPSMKYPIIAKPVNGHSSEGHIVLSTLNDWGQICNSDKYYFETMLNPGFREFSATIVNHKGTRQWMCIERLIIAQGLTRKACLIDDSVIAEALDPIVKGVACSHIYNIQVALLDGRYWILDLNPRFGYSELYRTNFGFNFIAMALGIHGNPLVKDTSLTERDAFRHLLAACQNA